MKILAVISFFEFMMIYFFDSSDMSWNSRAISRLFKNKADSCRNEEQ